MFKNANISQKVKKEKWEEGEKRNTIYKMYRKMIETVKNKVKKFQKNAKPNETKIRTSA